MLSISVIRTRRADDIHRAPEEVGRERGPDECRVPAIGAAVDRDALGVGHALLDGPPDSVHEVVVHPGGPLLVARV
jgi:hypothetical protein